MTTGSRGVQRIVRASFAVAVLLFGFLALSDGVAAQSLGDVAQREAARRKQAASGRVYTNEDLGPVEQIDQASPGSAPRPDAEAPTTPPANPGDSPGFIAEEDPQTGGVNMKPAAAPAPQRDEKYWRTTLRDLRARMAKMQASIQNYEARIAEIDAGPQSDTAAREREVISGTRNRLQKELRALDEEMAKQVTRARLEKAPEEWLR